MLFRPHLLMLGLVLIGCDREPARDNNGVERAQQEESIVRSPNTAADQIALDDMLLQHETGLRLANEALAKASHAELKGFASRFLAGQKPMVQQLKDWRKQWFGSATVPQITHHSAEPLTAGLEFDRKWLESMIQYHHFSSDLAQVTLNRKVRPELRQVAEKSLDEQNRWKKELEGYLKVLSKP